MSEDLTAHVEEQVEVSRAALAILVSRCEAWIELRTLVYELAAELGRSPTPEDLLPRSLDEQERARRQALMDRATRPLEAS